MPTTPVYALPYPAPSDPADIPADMQALATPLDSIIDALADRVAALEAVAPTAVELGYAERTSDLSVTAATEAAAQVLATLPTLTLAAVPHLLIVQVNAQPPQVGAASTILTCFDGAAISERVTGTTTPGSVDVMRVGLYWQRRFTPTAGSHTYSVRAWRTPSGTGNIQAGPGGAGNNTPAYIRLLRVI